MSTDEQPKGESIVTNTGRSIDVSIMTTTLEAQKEILEKVEKLCLGLSPTTMVNSQQIDLVFENLNPENTSKVLGIINQLQGAYSLVFQILS